jgi:hypothetical protein
MSFLAAKASRPLATPTIADSAAAAGGDSVAPRPSQWEEPKGVGNQCFRQAQFHEAVAAYSHALHALPETETLVKLLCNLAVAAGPDPLGPLEDATCALILKPSHVKAWARRVSALQALCGRDDAIFASCKAGRAAAEAALGSECTSAPERAAIEGAVGVFPKAEERVHAKRKAGGAKGMSAGSRRGVSTEGQRAKREAMRQGFSKADEKGHAKQKAGSARETGGNGASRGLSTDDQRAERKRMVEPADKRSGPDTSLEQMSTFRRLVERMSISEQKKIFGRKVEALPDIQMEMLNYGGGWPIGIDRGWAAAQLRWAFEEDSSSPLTLELHIKSKDYTPQIKDVCKRLWARTQPRFGGGARALRQRCLMSLSLGVIVSTTG